MTKTSLTLPVVLLLVGTAACGSSGETADGPQVSSVLNPYEERVSGTYELVDFKFYEVGSGICRASDFADWQGSLVLEEDRYAALQLELCEAAGGPTERCRHEFIWSADSGWIHLYPRSSEGLRIEMEWETEGGSGLETEIRVPDSHPECSYLSIEDGYERFVWTRAD